MLVLFVNVFAHMRRIYIANFAIFKIAIFKIATF